MKCPKCGYEIPEIDDEGDEYFFPERTTESSRRITIGVNP